MFPFCIINPSSLKASAGTNTQCNIDWEFNQANLLIHSSQLYLIIQYNISGTDFQRYFFIWFPLKSLNL